MAKYKHQRLFTLNNPYSPRLCPELAKEIGLNESIMLLQLEFWLATQGEEREDGYLWLRKTIREIQQEFTYWGTGTIGRILETLISEGFIVAASLDEGPGRSGRWMRFNFERLSTLQSIRVLSHSGKTVFPNIDDSVPDGDIRPYIGLKDKDTHTRAREGDFNQPRSLMLAKRHGPTTPRNPKPKIINVPVPALPDAETQRRLTADGKKMGFSVEDIGAMWMSFRDKHRLEETMLPEDKWGQKFHLYMTNWHANRVTRQTQREKLA